jgi:outer membrane immunogenic protein
MKKHTSIAGALAGVFAAAGFAAHAADLPPRPPYIPPPAVVVPAYNWTGIYIGVNGGYGWGRQDPLSLITGQYDKVNTDIGGWLVGGTFGGQIQSGRVVLGVEGDVDWTSIKGTATVVPTILGQPALFTSRLATEITTLSTARVRVGYAADNWLIYGTGGVAVATGKTTASLTGTTCGTVGNLACSGDKIRVGAAAGGGLEYGFTPNWSAKVEYIWIGGIGNDAYLHTVRGGLNYRFGGS